MVWGAGMREGEGGYKEQEDSAYQAGGTGKSDGRLPGETACHLKTWARAIGDGRQMVIGEGSSSWVGGARWGVGGWEQGRYQDQSRRNTVAGHACGRGMSLNTTTAQGTERRKNIVGQLNVLSSALAKNPFPCMERNPRRESYWKGLITDIFQQPITNKLTHKQL